MVFVRAYIRAQEQFSHLKGSKVEFSKGFNRPRWRTAFQKVFSWSWIKVQLFLPASLGMVIKAVSLACARSHLPLGVVAIIFGGPSIARAQGHSFSYQSSNPSFVLSTMFSFFEFCSIVARSLYLWILFMPAVITAPLANVFCGRLRQTWLHLVHHTLEFAGAAFIKWRQWAATRPDLFPRDLCIELTKLHANAPSHKFSYTVQTIERAFGKRLDEIFVEFDERPVASGSIAQVHKATLRTSGALGKQKGPMTVAVKVRHPGCDSPRFHNNQLGCQSFDLDSWAKVAELLEFFKAVALRDGRAAAQCALEFSKNQSCPNPAAFVKELETSFAFWGSKEADVIHPGECMQELLEQVRRHRVNVAGNVCTVMVTIMVLEGWQRKLDPEFSIMHTLQKLLFKQDWAESLAYTINGIMAP
ncbi:hypothetical protein L7F22_060310 [Adiantum nelumboides]|nr:hypothetical protein [Adiantum nelumboides]